ncbi:hypothetical protein [Urechidicola croceus]|uniref:hypothetical protein n=1 Tax=Urechidicola croceus TaxID=1850246 RepID=UPI0012E9FA82|nr:hypothetical protein [Urechidicola croceus]
MNTLLILLSFTFNIQLFSTYSGRFGFMGVYNTHNQVSYYFILFILFYYYKFIFKNEKPIKLIFVVVISFLIGTKKIYFFNLLLFSHYILNQKLYKKKSFYLLTISGIIIFTLFIEQIKLIFFQKFDVFVNIYQEKGLVTSITSYRNTLFFKVINDTILNHWNFLNYIFGGSEFYKLRVEFGWVDIYLFFGIFGLLVYFLFFKKLLIITGYNKFYLVVLVVVLGVDFFAGGFVSSANQPILFLLITAYFIQIKNQMNQLKVNALN